MRVIGGSRTLVRSRCCGLCHVIVRATSTGYVVLGVDGFPRHDIAADGSRVRDRAPLRISLEPRDPQVGVHVLEALMRAAGEPPPENSAAVPVGNWASR